MKILILSSKLPYPLKDGGAIATFNLARGLKNEGFDVTMLTFNTRKHFLEPKNIPVDIRNSFKIIAVNINTTIHPLKAIINLIFSSQPYISERFRSKIFADNLIRLLTENSYDIIQLEGPYLAYYLPVIRKHAHTQVALRAHNIEHEIWKRRYMNETRLFYKLYLKNLTKRIKSLEINLLKNVDILIPISERDSKILNGLNPGMKTMTIPAGIDIKEYPIKKIQPPKNIFFIGALDWIPNIDGLQWFINEVLPHIEKHDHTIRFHIAGRNASGTLKRILKHSMIEFYGEVDDARDFMTNKGIMVAPLLSGSGIRIKILEGMALGKCIVTTSIGAEGIPVVNGEHLLIADDGRTFANNIIYLLTNFRLASKISMQARKLIGEKFDTFVIATSLGDFYKKMA